MRNDFLTQLIEGQVSIESAYQNTPELLEQAIHSGLAVIGNATNLIESLESNLEFYFGSSDDVSLEAYENYTESVKLVLKANGIDLPVEVFTPSFEADEKPNKEEAAKKKDNVVIRVLKVIWKQIMKVVNWFKDLIKWKRSKIIKPHAGLIETKLAEVRAAISKFIPDSKARTYKYVETLFDKKYDQVFTDLGKIINHVDVIIGVVKRSSEGIGDYFNILGSHERKLPISIEVFKETLGSLTTQFDTLVDFEKAKALSHVNSIEKQWKSVRSKIDEQLMEVEKGLDELKSISTVFIKYVDMSNKKKVEGQAKDAGEDPKAAADAVKSLRDILGNMLSIANNACFVLVNKTDDVTVKVLNNIHVAADGEGKDTRLALPKPEAEPKAA